MSDEEGVPVVGGKTRRERKQQEAKEKLEQQYQELRSEAVNVGNADSPFAVNFEADQSHEGSRDIILRKVSVSVNSKVLFSDAEVKFSAGSRYGLMGPNGRGKTTLLKLLSTRELPAQKSLDILLVEQEQEVTAGELSATEAVLQSHTLLAEYSAEAAKLGEVTELSQEQMDRLSFLQEELKIMGSDQAEARARRILFGLGFPTDWHDRPTKSFSGGWRKRIALASAVFIEPDVLMLDEPTNHLDLNAVIWLESYLLNQYNEKQRRPKTLIIVSHDAGFLDSICTHIVHIEKNKLNYYRGGFSQFTAQLRQAHAEADKQYEAIQKRKMEKLRHGMSKEQAKEWEIEQVKLGKFDAEYLEKRREYTVTFPIPEPPKLRDACVVKLEGVSFNYPGGPTLFEDVNCALWTDSRITLCGPNGIGKSTLLNLLTGVLEPTTGSMTMNRLVRIGRYNQHFVDKLPLEQTPVTYLKSLGVRDDFEARKVLGSFGLDALGHMSMIAKLSGGQKARVAFAAISVEAPHFILFDEPTNHLDVESIEALVHTIKTFKGGILVVTHDARLITEAEMAIWVVDNKNVRPFNGTLEDYKSHIRHKFEVEEAQREAERLGRQLEKKNTRSENAAIASGAPPVPPPPAQVSAPAGLLDMLDKSLKPDKKKKKKKSGEDEQQSATR